MANPSTQTPTGGEDRPEGTRDVPVFAPVTDIFETADALIVLLEMPGVDRDSISITLEQRVLTIAGRSRLVQPEGYALALAEYRSGDYERSFTLSEAIDGDRIEAALKNGVLRVTLPKAKPEPAKSIAVKGE